ncbi:glycoside hydrolase family 19 protein [Sphingomonas crocodyli]|uniref:glycoside hydrolase family 19 protein n=1 Tax=Sphingomonas crocodyli TaxID=1979270 RepID=UPI0019D000B5|nr:glycoside hydrolase family 19 protein [Sphingomonas crocodyli]
MIDWRPIQKRLGLTPDGIDGRNTYTALFAFMAGRAPDDVLRSIGNSAAVHLPTYGMDKPQRLAWLLAETANETGSFTRFDENLNYSAEALVRTWPSRFTPASAPLYARKPEQIAEKAYGGRMGNDAPGDGWKYRGRGMLQLTGKDNYVRYDRRLGLGLDTNPEAAAIPALSLLIALEFYQLGKVMDRVDVGDLAGARKITNGGSIGLDHVKSLYAKAMGVLS